MANFQTKTISFNMSGCFGRSVTAFAKLWKKGAVKLCSKGYPGTKGGLGEGEGKAVLSTSQSKTLQRIQCFKEWLSTSMRPWERLRLDYQYQDYLDGKLDKSTLDSKWDGCGIFSVDNELCVYVCEQGAYVWYMCTRIWGHSNLYMYMQKPEENAVFPARSLSILSLWDWTSHWTWS